MIFNYNSIIDIKKIKRLTSKTEAKKINFQEIDVPIFDATGTDYLSNSERI